MATVDVEFERDVVALALRDLKFVRSAVPVLTRHNFTDKHLAWIWSVIAEVYAANKEMPTGTLFGAKLEIDYKDEDDQDYVEQVLVGLRRRQVPAPKSSLDMIRRFVRMTAVRDAAGGALDALDRGDPDEAEGAIVDGLNKAKATGLLEEPVNWVDGAADRLRAYTDGSLMPIACTALPGLDHLLNGGLRNGSLGLIIAVTNVGKSTFAVANGYAPLTHNGAVVVHTVTEETVVELGIKYDARFTGIQRERFIAGSLQGPDRDLYLKRFATRGKDLNRLILHEVAPGSKVTAIRVLADRAREAHPGVPLVIVVDTPDNLASGQRTKDKREDASLVAWGLKGLALDQALAPCCVWAVVHAPGAFEGKRLNAKAVSESYDKARAADVIVGLVETDEGGDEDHKAIEVQLVKNRLGKIRKYTLHTTADMGVCTFEEVMSYTAADPGAVAKPAHKGSGRGKA